MYSKKFQKTLDKSLQTMYTMRNRIKTTASLRKESDILNLSESLDPRTSQDTGESIRHIGEAINKTVEKYFPSLRTPIIAGGAIRDYVFGLRPNDYDIFMDISDVPEDEKEDVVLLFGMRVIDRLVEDYGKMYSSLENTSLQQLESQNYMGEKKGDPQGFVVYNVLHDTREDPVVGFDIREDIFSVKEPMRFILPQFIGHNDKNLSENPLTFLKKFDYDLVRGLYDPMTSSFQLAPSFVGAVNNKKIKASSSIANSRIRSFLSRMYYASDLKGTPYTIEKTYKKDLRTYSPTKPVGSSPYWFDTEMYRDVVI